MLQAAHHRFQHLAGNIGRMAHTLDAPRQPRQIRQCLVVQIHADTLSFGLQRLRQLQRAQPQALFASIGARLLDGGAFGLLGGADGVKIRGQQIRDGAGIRHILHRIGVRLVGGATQRADDIAMHLHRHMQPAMQVEFDDRA